MDHYVRRVDFGRRLEPAQSVIHGAGQSPDAFEQYYNSVEHCKPMIYMCYCGLKSVTDRFFISLKEQLNRYNDICLIPQIGLSMTKDGSPEEHYEHLVVEGVYDENIKILCEGLKALGRPVFIRIGYEFNGHWNGYDARAYKAAWIKVVNAFRDHQLDDTAVVWCYAPDGTNKDFMSFYPGDEYVDWWGIDCFSTAHFTASDTMSFMEAALKHNFPVMIGESTPRRIGVQDGEESWNNWFAPYFGFIRRHLNVKAFCYINWEWSRYPQWSDWGDGRIEENPEVLRRYNAELASDLYFHGASEKDIRNGLCRC